MAYDETLAARVKEVLSEHSDIAERKMFGGLAFMLAGNMCCCVTDKGLMVRVGPEGYEEALTLPHAGVMDITGRPMRGWVLVQPAGLESRANLAEWVSRGQPLPPRCRRNNIPRDQLSAGAGATGSMSGSGTMAGLPSACTCGRVG